MAGLYYGGVYLCVECLGVFYSLSLLGGAVFLGLVVESIVIVR